MNHARGFQLPADLEQQLRRDLLDLDAEAREVLLVDLYRRSRITHSELSNALGIARIELDGILKKHNVTEDLPTPLEISEDVENLRRLLNL